MNTLFDLIAHNYCTKKRYIKWEHVGIIQSLSAGTDKAGRDKHLAMLPIIDAGQRDFKYLLIF
jgi:hypothetical protein